MIWYYMILYYCQSLQIQTHLETHNGTQKKQHHESEDLSLRSCEWIFSTCSVAAEAGTFGGFWVFANSFAIIAPPCTQKMQTFESSARSEKRLPASKFYTSSKLCMVWFTPKNPWPGHENGFLMGWDHHSTSDICFYHLFTTWKKYPPNPIFGLECFWVLVVSTKLISAKVL